MKNKTHVIPISGKDSLATAIVQSVVNNPELGYTFIFNDVGAELPETYEWLQQVEDKMNWKIERIGENIEDLIKKYNVLPGRKMRFCTTKGKIKPFEEKFKKQKTVIVYYGLRADEPDRKGYVPHSNITPRYPLREKGITLPMVLSICKSQGLKPPTFFWQTLYDRVCEEMGMRSYLFDWKSCVSELEFDFLFAGRSRSNCYFCFFQRQYEIIWLSETHPELFENACRMEQDHGKEGYTWMNHSLPELIGRKDDIIQKRVKQVCKHIENRMNSQLFGGVEVDNELAFTGCGLLCGK